MTKRTTREEAIALLIAFYDLARANCRADLGTLAGRLGWGVGRVVRVLSHLEQRGMAGRAGCRLTLGGLAMSVALAAERDGAAADHAVLASASAA
jgi:hypothetical protein